MGAFFVGKIKRFHGGNGEEKLCQDMDILSDFWYNEERASVCCACSSVG